jgi:hypothetical protein
MMNSEYEGALKARLTVFMTRAFSADGLLVHIRPGASPQAELSGAHSALAMRKIILAAADL